jgi:two-component system, sensor histidine kinase
MTQAAAAASAVSTTFPGETGDESPKLRADRQRALFEQTPATLIGNVLGMGLVAMGFGALAPSSLLSWLAIAGALWVLRLLHYLRFRRTPDADVATMLSWRRSWQALVLLQGATWPLAVWLFWNEGESFHQLALILISYSYTLGSVQLLATQSRLFFAFIAIVLVPIIVRVASDTNQPWHWQLAVVMALLFAITVVMGRSYRNALLKTLELKHHADELAAQLRTEKAAAEEARALAEAASRAKTQFFAAASHDLRQPLHAMGLFAEALRQRTTDAEVAPLVNSINQSVDALEGLFSELLDLTRIDAGGVDVQPAPVRMRDVFERLRLHFEPVAFEKGLALGFHGGQRVAHADSVLLERILRNLVSNAIRYTIDGGVLVACRPRADKLLIQVWDSGIGIRPEALARIFDEFYQINGSVPLQADQRKGLGLGLAIVSRLAELMDVSLTVQSRTGRGTVFSLLLPQGRATRTLDPVSASTSDALRLHLTLNGRRIVVVEDESAVREGLKVLLESWGADVQAFDDVPELRAALNAGTVAEPDLALVDYRLPEGRTGLVALAALRACWPLKTLPAVVITGSTMVGHEDEAAAHDFHVLLKPVLPSKLRAMIAFKLGLR